MMNAAIKLERALGSGIDLASAVFGPSTAPTKPDTEPVAPPEPAKPATPVRQPDPDPGFDPTTVPGPCHEPIPGICPIRH